MEKEIIVISFTRSGTEQNRELCEKLCRSGVSCCGYAPGKYAEGDIRPLPVPVGSFTGEAGEGWGSRDFVFIGAAGIAVRSIAPWVKDKFTDPAVLVMDGKGDYVLPILSGHVGGAAALADKIADLIGGRAVHTTATDVQGKFAVDVFAVRNHLLLSDRITAKEISAAILEGEKTAFFCDVPGSCVLGDVPDEIVICRSLRETEKYRCRILVTGGKQDSSTVFCQEHIADNMGEEKKEKYNRNNSVSLKTVLVLRPRNIIAGIGCRKNISSELLEQGLKSVLREHGLTEEQLMAVASIDLKKEETALLALAQKYRIPFVTYSPDELREISNVSTGSVFVEEITGVDNVCERAALKCVGDERFCCREGELIQKKCIRDSMTVALAACGLRISF